jgi:hypothetical protein
MKVLLTLDGSPHSHAALTEFATRPWPNGSEVEILTVIHPGIPLFMEPTLLIAALTWRKSLRYVAKPQPSWKVPAS